MTKPGFIFLFIIFLFAPAFAQEIPVNLRAEKLKYIEGTGIIEASGSVEAHLQDVIIYADFLRMDSETNIATAEGRVRMVARDYQASADTIIYDADTEHSTFSNFNARFSPKKVRGPLYVKAKDLQDLGDKMLGESGKVSTCGYQTPHYFVIGDKIEYYPDDKIIGYNVTLYMGGAPVFWMPYLLYDLSKKGKRNWAFGNNAVEGNYIKSSWGYPLGLLYLDLMEKKGFGKGTAIDYDLMGLGLGSLYLYHLGENDTGITDWVTRVKHKKQINPWTTLSLDHNYMATYLIPSGRRDQTTFGLDLAYKDKARWNLKINQLDNRMGFLSRNSLQFKQAYQKISTNYYINYDYAKKSPYWVRASQRFYHKRPLWSDKVMLTTRVNFYNNISDLGKVGDERLEPMIEIRGREPNYSWRYTQNWYVDLDQDRYTADDSYQYLEKHPEIEISPKALDLKLFTLRSSFGLGKYHEVRYVPALGGNRDYTTERYKASLNASKKIPLALSTVVVLGAGLDQFLYTPGDQLYAYRESMSVNTKLFDFFRNDINYRKGSTDGNTPFLFDRLGTNYHNVSEKMTFYYKTKFIWTINGGHNWQTHKWFNVNTNLLLRPNEKVYWNLRTGWDIENTRYLDLVNTLKLKPYTFFSMSLSTVSDLNDGELKSGSAVYEVLLLAGQPNQWKIKLGQVFERATKQSKIRDIMVVKDLHCWELKYTYSDYRKEFSFTFTLKALPDEPLGMSSGRGFYMEGFEKGLKEINPEGAVKRY